MRVSTRSITPASVRTVVVCLPPHIPTRTLPDAAAASLAAHGLTAAGVMPHFLARTRRAGALVELWRGTTAGGQIRHLDLDLMRRNAADAASAHWLLWHRVVAGTRPAQPWWAFADRHLADPRRHPLERVQADYRAQPRVLAMTAYNALARRPVRLPEDGLEALQAGQPTYVTVARLAAVAADGLASTGDAVGGWFTTGSARLSDQLAYLDAATAVVGRLRPDAQLLAVAVHT